MAFEQYFNARFSMQEIYKMLSEYPLTSMERALCEEVKGYMESRLQFEGKMREDQQRFQMWTKTEDELIAKGYFNTHGRRFLVIEEKRKPEDKPENGEKNGNSDKK